MKRLPELEPNRAEPDDDVDGRQHLPPNRLERKIDTAEQRQGLQPLQAGCRIVGVACGEGTGVTRRQGQEEIERLREQLENVE